jgi:flagellar hook-basal body complex protein FliE
MIDKISSDMLLGQMEQMKESVNTVAPPEAEVPEGSSEMDFKNVLGSLIKEVDQAQKEADSSLKGLATGETNSIQEVVMKMEEADVSFKLMKEIRNKLLQAYKDIMSMQS